MGVYLDISEDRVLGTKRKINAQMRVGMTVYPDVHEVRY